MLKPDDEEIEGDKELLDHATNHYKSLFAHSKKNNFEVDDLLWKDDEKVCSEDNALLSTKFDLEEIRELFFKWKETKHHVLMVYQQNSF
jgi:hypothetical protein